MDRITALQARRAGIIEKMEAIVASVPADQDMTAEQVTAFEALKAEDDKATKELEIARDIERRKAAAAKPAAALPGATAPAATLPARPAEPGLAFGRIVHTLARAGGNVRLAAEIAEAQGDGALFANQNTLSGTAGGFLVPEDVQAEIVPLLRASSVIMASSPVMLPMPNGNLTVNRETGAGTFSYGGEQANIGATGYQFGQMKLTAKKLSGIVPLSNELLKSASTAVDRFIRDRMATDMGLAMDVGFIRGSGVGFNPLGLRNQHTGTPFATTHVLTMTATPTLTTVTSDLGRLELALEGNNVPMVRPTWLMHPRTKMFLMNLRDGNGNFAFPEVAINELRGKPIAITTQIPINLGGGTNESELYLVDFSQVIIGEQGGLEIAVSTEAAYIDSGSTMRAAFSRDETVMRAIQLHDIGLYQLAACAILTGVTWTP